MKRKRHGTEAIIRKLREAEVLQGQGQTIGHVCQRLEISEQTLHQWRKQFRGMGADHIRRLKELEEETPSHENHLLHAVLAPRRHALWRGALLHCART
jgi:transposase-like protein